MNAVLLFIIGIPLIEIYLMIKIGGTIGAFNTIFLILFTAVTGVYFARLEGLNTIRSGFGQLIRNEMPIHEIISGAAIAFAAFLLIIPGFLTDFFGFLLLIPITRKILLKNIFYKFKKNEINQNIIEGDITEEEVKLHEEKDNNNRDKDN